MVNSLQPCNDIPMLSDEDFTSIPYWVRVLSISYIKSPRQFHICQMSSDVFYYEWEDMLFLKKVFIGQKQGKEVFFFLFSSDSPEQHPAHISIPISFPGFPCTPLRSGHRQVNLLHGNTFAFSTILSQVIRTPPEAAFSSTYGCFATA